MTPQINQDIINLYDTYTHKPLPRREFIERLAKLVGGSAAAVALLPYLENNYAQAALIDPKDSHITVSEERFVFDSLQNRAYVAAPAKKPKAPAVIVIHENRGLNPHIEDVTRRLGVEGFLAIGVDALSLLGGTPKDEDAARDLIGKLDPAKTVALYASAVAFAKNHAKSSGKVGCVGFCWGGGMALRLAANSSDLGGVVAYYGMQPKSEEVHKIVAPILLHYAALDDRINAGILSFATQLVAQRAEFTMHHYAGVNHAFNNDTNAARYDKKAADLAWGRTVGFLRSCLG